LHFRLQSIGPLEGYNICRQTKLYLQAAAGCNDFYVRLAHCKRMNRGLKFTREASFCLRRLVTREFGAFVLSCTNSCEDGDLKA